MLLCHIDTFDLKTVEEPAWPQILAPYLQILVRRRD